SVPTIILPVPPRPDHPCLSFLPTCLPRQCYGTATNRTCLFLTLTDTHTHTVPRSLHYITHNRTHTLTKTNSSSPIPTLIQTYAHTHTHTHTHTHRATHSLRYITH